MHKLDIDARHWAELNRLLGEALDQPAAQRAHWIETLAPGFDALKPSLRDLLSRAAEVETSDFLKALPKVDVVDADEPTADARTEQPGDLVGPYRLVRELGGGGMGTVWLAQRPDGLINRPVALKLPHGAWRRTGLAERMAREREILATLNHPNIARLYDAGLSAAGQPYLALEYVAGRPIDAYCRDQQLGPKAASNCSRRSPTPSPMRTASWSFTAISSPRTSWSPPRARCGCSTSASRNCWMKATLGQRG